MTEIETYEKQNDVEKPPQDGELISGEATSLARPSEVLPGVLFFVRSLKGGSPPPFM